MTARRSRTDRGSEGGERAELCLQRYEGRAESGDWVQAHGWNYSEDVARRTIADIREKLGVRPGDRVLEVGCGSGALLDALLDAGDRGVGVDRCAALLRQATRFGVDLLRIRLLAADIASLPLGDGRFDRVLCYSVFGYLTDLGHAERALEEMARVCRAGGTLMVGDVPGRWERVRACWSRYGPRTDTVRAALLLPPLSPLRLALRPLAPLFQAVQRLRGQRETGDEGRLNYLWYGHGFFRRWGARHGCRVEIMPQRIPGRQVSDFRFDVRFTGLSGTGRSRSGPSERGKLHVVARADSEPASGA